MKISKHLHSCLLIEDQGKTVLIDPGNFSYLAKALDIQTVEKLDYVLITHGHPDHCYLPFIQDIVAKFPDVKIITNDEVVGLLQKENIQATSRGNDVVKLTPVPHEKLWDSKPPENVQFTVFGKFSDPGDSFHFDATAKVLALPIQAPWGATTDAVNLAVGLKPEVIIPVHDWMWRDEFRKIMYTRLQEFFKTKSIDFKAIETGEILEV